ncbi:hypothetical protein [Streptacidiphilus anmyonensis]|uniref:hypothetical protein n=1 Tax=Streptacidiphilus anmyonensis TaxID=405782 RepID=UPI0005AB21D9|nr:hypothetical protein [Streptacidiphilus anmyonensis]
MYRVTYTLEAKATRDSMPPHRQALLDRGLAVLAQDPFHKASTYVGTNEADRKAQVAPGILVEYFVSNAFMVVAVIEVFDDSLIADD